MGRKWDKAFSLVELLVVLGIIAVLISLLMPTLSKAQQSARQVQCASQLRQVGMGLLSYAGSNGGYYPDWSGWQVYGGDGTGEDSEGLGWTEKIEQYIGRPGAGIYHCPAFPEEVDFDYFLSVRWASVNNRDALMVTDVKKQSEFILSGDCNSPGFYPFPFGDKTLHRSQDCDKDDALAKAVLFFGEQNGRSMHYAGNNILFADGHVMPMKEFDIEQMTYHPKKMLDWDDVADDGR